MERLVPRVEPGNGEGTREHEQDKGGGHLNGLVYLRLGECTRDVEFILFSGKEREREKQTPKPSEVDAINAEWQRNSLVSLLVSLSVSPGH